jgi:hypothetical protein
MKDQQSPFANANAPNPNDPEGTGGEVLHATIEQAELMQRGGVTAVEWAASNVLLPGFERHELSEAQVMQRFDECVRGARIARSDEKRIRTQMEKRMRKLHKQWHTELEHTLAKAREDALDNEIGDA